VCGALAEAEISLYFRTLPNRDAFRRNDARQALHLPSHFSDLPSMKESGTLPKMGGLPINALRGSLDQPNGRGEERFLAERSVHIVYKGQPRTAWLVDCSAHGLQLVSKEVMQALEEFHVEVRLHGKFRLVRYHVKYWFQLWDDSCQIGAEMTEEVPEAEAKLILAELVGTAQR
jgi:hypothetical protein